MSLSATTEFINICMKADKALREVDDVYSMYQEILDKGELRKDVKAMEFLSIYKYDIYNEVSNSLYGGKRKDIQNVETQNAEIKRVQKDK